MRKINLLLILAATFVEVKAQPGCLNALTSTIYTSTATTQGFAYTNYALASALPFVFAGVPCPYYRSFSYIAGNPRCCINGVCNIQYYQINYTRVDCPIDDLSWILMLGGSIISVIALRKSSLQTH